MNVFLLDDEKNARETVKAYLSRSTLSISSIQEASSVSEGLETLAQFKPDLAFLDINLPDGTSFDLLSQLDSIDFKIVFISAYDEYAVKAFKFNALDYILKPINPLEFKAALDKVPTQESPLSQQIEHLHQTISSKEFNKLVLRDSQSIHFVDVEDIVQCKSENNYTIFALKEDQIVISKTLGEYEELLRGKGFFRAHRSHLINMRQISKYDKREGGYIKMNNGESVPLARNRKEIFMQLIDRI